jgi:hypothetical protein
MDFFTTGISTASGLLGGGQSAAPDFLSVGPSRAGGDVVVHPHNSGELTIEQAALLGLALAAGAYMLAKRKA